MEPILQYAASHPFLFGGMLLMFAVVFAYEMRVARRKGTDVSAPEAVAMINAGAQPVDIRAAAQYEKAHILDARNIPLGDLDQHLASLEKLKDRGILLYCDNGAASAKAVETLAARGVPGAKSLRGGLTAWRGENLPVFSGRKSRKKDAS
ncbi:MAG TPA: rhodanese-like domain-containing protein [Gammaproteobacteria bacterium]|nr:rhodanese-like domain-containing protein [Gammaproteobacteria bacterium]